MCSSNSLLLQQSKEFVQDLEQQISRKSCKWRECWGAWSATISKLGLAMAWLPTPDSTCFHLNEAARKDLGISSEEISFQRFSELKRSFLLQEHDFAVWTVSCTSSQEMVLNLTRREEEVLQRMSIGESIKETASDLGVSPRTIEKHRENIRKKRSHKPIV